MAEVCQADAAETGAIGEIGQHQQPQHGHQATQKNQLGSGKGVADKFDQRVVGDEAHHARRHGDHAMSVVRGCHKVSMKLRSLSERLGCLSLRSALASI